MVRLHGDMWCPWRLNTLMYISVFALVALKPLNLLIGSSFQPFHHVTQIFNIFSSGKYPKGGLRRAQPSYLQNSKLGRWKNGRMDFLLERLWSRFRQYVGCLYFGKSTTTHSIVYSFNTLSIASCLYMRRASGMHSVDFII